MKFSLRPLACDHTDGQHGAMQPYPSPRGRRVGENCCPRRSRHGFTGSKSGRTCSAGSPLPASMAASVSPDACNSILSPRSTPPAKPLSASSAGSSGVAMSHCRLPGHEPEPHHQTDRVQRQPHIVVVRAAGILGGLPLFFERPRLRRVWPSVARPGAAEWISSALSPATGRSDMKPAKGAKSLSSSPGA